MRAAGAWGCDAWWLLPTAAGGRELSGLLPRPCARAPQVDAPEGGIAWASHTCPLGPEVAGIAREGEGGCALGAVDRCARAPVLRAAGGRIGLGACSMPSQLHLRPSLIRQYAILTSAPPRSNACGALSASDPLADEVRGRARGRRQQRVAPFERASGKLHSLHPA